MTSQESAVSAKSAESATTEADQLILKLDGTRIYPRTLVGGKAHGISKIRTAGLPAPPAFVATVDACHEYFEEPDGLIEHIWPDVTEGIAWLESESGHTFGTGPVPLLVSVRSGAAASMPGMMDTVLNLGINDEVERILAAAMGDDFARDTHRRFREIFRQVVAPTGGEIPYVPMAQLRAAVRAVFESWNSPRAVSYRRHHGLDGKMAGTAVTVQAMVFGNLDERSGTGVLFSRDPLTGDNRPFGEWLPRGQGEDVVSGKFDPLPLDVFAADHPLAHSTLLEAARWLEADGADMQDIEFTVEAGQLFLLQTRAAKRSSRAAVAVAVALQREGLIDEDEALARVTPAQLDVLLTPVISASARESADVIATGLPACPGVGAGVVVGDSEAAEDAADADQNVVLARKTTSPDDVSGMIAASAVITELGGATSHAAVVSRELHTPCVVGCGRGTLTSLIGSEVTVDGGTGTVFAGLLPLTERSEESDPDLSALLKWARERSPVQVHAVGSVPVGTEAITVDHRSPETVRSALAAGATILCARHPLPVLLMVLEHARRATN